MKRRSYRITISEPWDFKNPDGSNIISGQIIRILNDQFAIFRCDEKVSINGYRGFHFLLSPRISNEFFTKDISSISVMVLVCH